MSNFDFLNTKWPTLAKLGKQAESYYHTDNNASMQKICMFDEQIMDLVFAKLKIQIDSYASQDDKIKEIRNTKINKAIPGLFDIVRCSGNKRKLGILTVADTA